MTTKRLSPQRLRMLRAGHEPKLSQGAVAAKAGLKLARYWYLETKSGPATPEEVKAIAKALKVPQKAIAVSEASA